MDLPKGTKLQNGKYQISETIGNGGFAYTYLAKHTYIKEQVAIKELFLQGYCLRSQFKIGFRKLVIWDDNLAERCKEMFLREVKTLWKLRQSHIVHVMDVFEENNTIYLVMEYIQGNNLAKILHDKGPILEKDAVSYIKQVAKGLRYMHRKNRIHLDIKPSNIIIGRKGYAYIVDLGASVHLDESGEPTKYPNAFTAHYAPYELITCNQHNNQLSAASDIYSLGATLYTLITGWVPTDSVSRMRGTEHLRELPSTTNPGLRAIIVKAMRKSPKNRYQSMDAIIKELEKLNL